MKLFHSIKPKASEVYCILHNDRPVEVIWGNDTQFKLKIIGWPYTFVTESALTIEEEFPKLSSTLKPFEILHGTSDSYSTDPLDVRVKTLATFILRFKITDFLIFLETVKSRQGLIDFMQSTIISESKQECIKNSLAYNLKNIKEINQCLLDKAIEITQNFGVDLLSIDLVIKLSAETDQVLNNYSKARAEGFSSAELEKALYYAKGQGISKLAEMLKIDDTTLVYKIESIAQSLKKSNYNFYSLNDQDKDITQKVLTLFHSSQQS